MCKKFWIRKDGKLFGGEYHTEVAAAIFPHAENPEYACEKAGYLKVYVVGAALRAMTTGHITQAQVNALDKLSIEHSNECSIFISGYSKHKQQGGK